MRNSELQEGIDVFDRYNRVVGTSRAAARKVGNNLGAPPPHPR